MGDWQEGGRRACRRLALHWHCVRLAGVGAQERFNPRIKVVSRDYFILFYFNNSESYSASKQFTFFWHTL